MPNKWWPAAHRRPIKMRPHCPAGSRSAISRWHVRNRYEIRPMLRYHSQRRCSIASKTRKNEPKRRKSQKVNYAGTVAAHSSIRTSLAMPSRVSCANRHDRRIRDTKKHPRRRHRRLRQRHRRVFGSAKVTRTIRTTHAIHHSAQRWRICSLNNTSLILSSSNFLQFRFKLHHFQYTFFTVANFVWNPF